MCIVGGHASNVNFTVPGHTYMYMYVVLFIIVGHVDIVRMLLKHNADPMIPMAGQRIVDLAKEFGHDLIVKQLEIATDCYDF